MGTKLTFKDCLEYEMSQQAFADTFLKQVYPGETIYRPKWTNPADRRKQQADIDVELRHIDPDTHWPVTWTISEKFRKGLWPNDIYVELYSDFKKKREGWGLMSQAQEYHIYYGTGNDAIVRVVPVWGVKKLCKEIKWLYDPVLQHMDEQNHNGSCYLYKGNDITLRFDGTYNKSGKMVWKNAAVIIPLEIFKYINCKVTQYGLIKGAWVSIPDRI